VYANGHHSHQCSLATRAPQIGISTR
jgi:hypothetical protein